MERKSGINFALLMFGLFFVLGNTHALFSQSASLDDATKTKFSDYIKKLSAEKRGVKIEPDEWGLSRVAMPIDPEYQELCDKVKSYIDQGGNFSIFLGWYMWFVSFDSENNRIILTDSGK
ncbi:MAG: hypothetical protein LBO04_04980 [Spirochaetaceae bacterium]|jgi:hypothetical protein|nr:hypothetical protein [Spirochaetaceae bacterium]